MTMNTVDGHDDIMSNTRVVLDDEVILWEEILSRLPVKSLMRFRCVCRRWRYLIRNDRYFIDLHRSLTSKTRSSGVCLLLAILKDNVFSFLLANLCQGRAVVQTVTNSGIGHTILSPVNGLICFKDDYKYKSTSVCIYNPGTREVTPWIKTTISKELEEKTINKRWCRHRPVFVLGFHPATKEHKVICLWSMFKSITLSNGLHSPVCYQVCEVLTVGQNSWRQIDEVPPYMLKEVTNTVCVNGSIYIRSFSNTVQREVILVFDLGTEKFRDMPIPSFILDRSYTFEYNVQGVEVLEVDGHFALLHRVHPGIAKLWIFDDEEGLKGHSISSNSINWIEETILLPEDENFVYHFQAIAGTDQLIVTCHRSLEDFIIYSYDRKKKTFTEVEISGISPLPRGCFLVTTFAESLVSVRQQQPHHQHIEEPPAAKTY